MTGDYWDDDEDIWPMGFILGCAVPAMGDEPLPPREPMGFAIPKPRYRIKAVSRKA